MAKTLAGFYIASAAPLLDLSDEGPWHFDLDSFSGGFDLADEKRISPVAAGSFVKTLAS